MHVFSNRSSIVTVRSLPLFIVTRSVRTNHDEDDEAEDEDEDVLRRSSRDKTIGPTFSSDPAVKDDDGFDVAFVVVVVVVVSDDEVSLVATETSPSSPSASFTLSPPASPRCRRL